LPETAGGWIGQPPSFDEDWPVLRSVLLGRRGVAGLLGWRAPGLSSTRVAAGAERRFFVSLILIQGLVIAWLFLALAAPKTLDALTREQLVRGMLVEAPLDRATGWVMLVGTVLALTAVVMMVRRAERGVWFWIGYSLLLALGTLEESDWLRTISGKPPRVAGREMEGLHDLLQIVYGPSFRSRGGPAEYLFPAELVLAAVILGVGVLGLVLWSVARKTRSLDGGMIALIMLGALLAGLGALVDANILPVPLHFDSKTPLEEPLESLGGLCLVLVAAEAALRAVATRPRSGTAPSPEQPDLRE
jgi:hypothetical protein